MKFEKITATIDPSSIQKASKFWPRDICSIFVELTQNAYRAGASHVTVKVEAGRISVTDNGKGVSDPSVLLRFGGSGWDGEVVRSQDAAGMGVFCLAAFGCEISSRVPGQAEGWRATFTPEVFAGQDHAEVVWTAEVAEGTTISFPWNKPGQHHREIQNALAGTATYAPMVVELIDETIPDGAGNMTLGMEDFLSGAVRVEHFDGYSLGVFKVGASRRITSGASLRSYSAHRSAVCFHGLVVEADVASIVPVNGDGFIVHVDLHRTDEIHMTLPQRNAVIENEAWQRLRQNARQAILRHIATLDRHSFGFKIFEEARRLGLDIKEATPALKPFHAVDADTTASWGEREPKELPQGRKVLLVGDDFEPDEAQSFDHVRLKLEPEFAFFSAHGAFGGYSWYDRLPVVSDVRWLVSSAGAVTEIVRHDDERAHYVGSTDPEAIDGIEAILSISVGDATDEMRVPTEFLIMADDCWSPDEAELLVTRDAKLKRLVTGALLVDRLMAAVFCASDDAEADSYETQRDYAERCAVIMVNRLLLSERDAALEATRTAVLRWITSECGVLTKEGAVVTITVSKDKVEVTASASSAA